MTCTEQVPFANKYYKNTDIQGGNWIYPFHYAERLNITYLTNKLNILKCSNPEVKSDMKKKKHQQQCLYV